MLQREVVVWMHFWNCHQTQLLPPSLKTAVSCGNPDTWCELNWYLLKQPWSNLALSPLESMYIYSKELWFHIAFSFGLNKFSAVNLWVGALCIRLHAPVMGWVLGTPHRCLGTSWKDWSQRLLLEVEWVVVAHWIQPTNWKLSCFIVFINIFTLLLAHLF